jgi:hypothetical protein
MIPQKVCVQTQSQCTTIAKENVFRFKRKKALKKMYVGLELVGREFCYPLICKGNQRIDALVIFITTNISKYDIYGYP